MNNFNSYIQNTPSLSSSEKGFAKFLIYVLFIFSINTTQAANQEVSPSVILANIVKQFFSRIASHQEEIEKFPEYMREIIEEELMPSIDYQYAAYKILDKHLSEISQDQRETFVTSIRYYLIRSYVPVFTQYKDQQIIFELVTPTNPNQIVAINAKIIDGNLPDIDIIFKMRQNKKTKQWKVIDMEFKGLSLLHSKQIELNARITKQGIVQVNLELTYIK